MDQNKLCEQHQGKICLKICSHFDCNQISRLVCQECINQKLHQHNELFSVHIKSISEFKQYVKQEIVEQKYQETMSIKILEIGVQTVNNILIDIREMMNLFDNILMNTQQIKVNISSLSSSTTNSIQMLTQNQLNDIFLIEKNKDNFFQFNDFQNKIQQMEKQSNEAFKKISQAKKKYLITENVQAYFDIQGQEHYLLKKPKNEENFMMTQKQINYLQQQFQNIKPLIYCSKDIDYMNKQDCFLEIQQINKQIIIPKYSILEINKNDLILLACTISPDEKFLVYSSEDEQMHIYDLDNKNLKETITVDCLPSYMTFTNDSKLLIIGNYDGEVLCFDFTDNFRQSYKNQIHKDIINEIKFINSEEIISCSNDGSIVITNTFYSRQDLIVTNTPRSWILSIDYDFKNRVIVSSSEDRSIKFYYYDGRQLFSKLKAHRYGVYQMQIIQNKNKLITLCLLGKLKIWQIDYRKKEITQTLLISQIITFQNFITSQDDNRFILINQKFVQIHDKFQQKIYQIKHKTHECNILYHQQLQQRIMQFLSNKPQSISEQEGNIGQVQFVQKH